MELEEDIPSIWGNVPVALAVVTGCEPHHTLPDTPIRKSEKWSTHCTRVVFEEDAIVSHYTVLHRTMFRSYTLPLAHT